MPRSRHPELGSTPRHKKLQGAIEPIPQSGLTLMIVEAALYLQYPESSANLGQQRESDTSKQWCD